MDLAEVGHMDVASHRSLGNVSCISKNLGKLYCWTAHQHLSGPDNFLTQQPSHPLAGYFQIITALVQAHQEPPESILWGFLFLQPIYMNYPSSGFSVRREGQVVMMAALTEVRNFPNAATNRCPTVTTLALEGNTICYPGLLLVKNSLLLFFLSSFSFWSSFLPPLIPHFLSLLILLFFTLFLLFFHLLLRAGSFSEATLTIFQWNPFYFPSPSHLWCLIICILFFKIGLISSLLSQVSSAPKLH